MRWAKTVPISVAQMPLRRGRRRTRTATRPSSPTRPGRTAFANRPTQNAEKTSRKPGRGAAIACRITVFQATERTSTETRLSATAATTHGQRTAVKASRTRCQSGPRHQIRETATAEQRERHEQTPAAAPHAAIRS